MFLSQIILTLSAVLTIAQGKYTLTPFYVYRGPPAPLAPDGRVIDTAEVAHARATHLAAHAEAIAKLRESRKGIDREPKTTTAPPMTQSMAPLGSDGRVVDTPEVAQAKAAHLEAHARAAARTAPRFRFDVYDGRRDLVYVAPVRIAYTRVEPIRYQGPEAPLGRDGRVVDTPEVAMVREQHLKAHKQAASMAAQSEDPWTESWENQWQPDYY